MEEAEEGLPEDVDLQMQAVEEVAAAAGRETEAEVADPPPSPVMPTAVRISGTIPLPPRSRQMVGESNQKQPSHLPSQLKLRNSHKCLQPPPLQWAGAAA